MSARAIPIEAIDKLNQVRDELRVVWLAIRNEEAAELLPEIGEHVNGLANRVHEICIEMGEDK